MSGFFSLPIKTQLYLMAFIVALPAAGIIVYSGLDQRRIAMAEALTETNKLADNIAIEQQAQVASAKQLLSALAQLPEIKSGDDVKVQPILADILKLNPPFLNIFVTDRTGRVRSSAKELSRAQLSAADRRYFLNARSSGQFSSGEYIIGRLLKKPTMSFGYPYQDKKGAFSGVIVVGIDLEFTSSILKRAKLPPGSSYVLIDYQGMIITSGLNPERLVGKKDSSALFARMQAMADSGSYRGVSNTGVMRFVGYRKLRLDNEKIPYLYVRAGIPVDMAVAKANHALLVNLALLTPFMLAALLLVWLIAKYSIIDPVAVLRAASRRLAAGDLQTRVSHLVAGGELGELGRAFDEMAVKLAREISDCKQAEEEIRQLHLGLEERVRERTQLLEAAIKELETFSYSVSHDLRSPLRHINSYLAILVEDFGDSFPAEARNYMARAGSASVKMGKLIDGLLELSGVGRAELTKTWVDLSALACGIAEMLRETEPTRVAKFAIAKELWALGDQNMLRLLLLNLLGNAWKYTSRTPSALLEFGETVCEGGRVFFVRDNGAGFDMTYKEKLFGTFERLHGEEYEGTGIGLATVKRIMERHGGTVWGESELGKSTTFYFGIP